MERTYFTCLVLCVLLSLGLSGSSNVKQPIDRYQSLFFDSYVKGEMENWPEWIEEINRDHKGDVEAELVSLQAQYGLIGYYLGTRQKIKARKQIRSAYDQLQGMMGKYSDDARFYSLHAAFNAFKISLAVYKAPVLGPRIEKSIHKAMSINPEEPTCWLENGNSLYNRPEMFGGDKKKAIESFKKSLRLFNEQGNEKNYLKVLVEVFIIKGYLETNQPEKYQQARKELESKYNSMDWIDEFLEIELIE